MKTILILLTLAIKTGATLISYSGGEQVFQTVITGNYSIVAYGASGGNGEFTSGGNGAETGGTFYLTAGEVLDI